MSSAICGWSEFSGSPKYVISLFIHVWYRSVAAMLNRKLIRRALSRLITGLFAVQLIAAGLCLMMPQAHAMPMVNTVHSISDSMANTGHCTQPMETHMSQDMEYSSCTHCDQPDSFLKKASTPVQLDIEMLPDLLAAPNVSEWISPSVSLFSRTPTGSPRTSSFLYQTTQRILI